MSKNDFDLDFDFQKEYGIDPDTLTDDADDVYGNATGNDGEAPLYSDDDFDLDALLRETQEAQEALEAADKGDVDVPDFFDSRTPASREDSIPSTSEEYDTEEEPPEPSDLPVENPESYEEEEEEEEERPRKERKPIQLPQIKLPKFQIPKLKTPNIFTRFYDLYFAPLTNKDMILEPQDPNNPRRRRRKSPRQIFKEIYLPPMIVCVSTILILSFVIGSVSDVIARKLADRATQQSQLSTTEDAAALKEQEYQRVLTEAEELASGYFYEAAIKKLESFGDMTQYPELQAKRASYVNTMNALVEHKDISTIPNLSFHVLMADPARAFKDAQLGGKYNRNFVSTTEFAKILEQLYTNGYVLVDFDSVTGSSVDATGQEKFFPRPIYLPADKKPIMLTETLVNYFAYMIDGNGDGVADAQGDGFASKLVVSGDTVKAEYVDGSGQTLVGDFDFVPILESFIAEHPDFSYQGARATLAVCGYEGVFGYRTNTSYIATKGNDYYNNEVAGAKAVAAKLRELGYTIACYTYGNEDYSSMTANQISADLNLWKQQITPVLGDVNTIVFALAKDIKDYSGNAFQVLYTSGFRYFVAYSNQQPWAEINTNFVRQKRLMVTGNSMAWYSSQFNGMFDCAAILDKNLRGNVPN